MKTVDLIVPCYNESAMIDLFYEKTAQVVSQIDGYSFTFIFVDDGSTDDTLQKIKALATAHRCVKYISFSRNFKKEADNVECRGDFNSISMRLAHFRFANGRRDKGGGNRRGRRFARNSKHDSKQENIA